MTWRYAVQFAVPLGLVAWLVWLPGELRAIGFNHHFPVRGDRIEAL